VTVVEKAAHALPQLDAEMAGPLHAELAAHGVALVVALGWRALQAKDGLVGQVELENGQRIETDFVLLSIGVRPSVQLAREAGLTIGLSGAIAVDDVQRTNDPDIYAVGDAAEITHGVTGEHGRIPLAGPANRQGRLAGEHAATAMSKYLLGCMLPVSRRRLEVLKRRLEARTTIAGWSAPRCWARPLCRYLDCRWA